MNAFLRSSMISSLANVDARSSTPLFHVQANGWPSIAQIKMGFCAAIALFCASSKPVIQGIVRHGSWPDVCSCLCSRRYSSIVIDWAISGLIVKATTITRNRKAKDMRKDDMYVLKSVAPSPLAGPWVFIFNTFTLFNFPESRHPAQFF